jgi:chromosome partitioning protein
VVEQLHGNAIEILPVPLVEKEAFRDLFAHGGDLAALEERGVYGAPAALQNTRAYTGSIVELLRATNPTYGLA